MSNGRAKVVASGRRMPGPAQGAGRAVRSRGRAAKATAPHPLEYQMYYTV